MARYTSDLKIATSLFEAAAMQDNIQVTCPHCRNGATFNPHALWWLFERKGWHDDFRRAGWRFRCVRCGNGNGLLAITKARPTVAALPMPDEREWKRAVNRYRG